MPYYFVCVEYVNKEGKPDTLMYYNLDLKSVKNEIVVPFEEGRQIAPLGIILNPSQITRITIFVSEKKYGEIILPSGKRALDSPHKYVVHCFFNSMVKGVRSCTHKYVNPVLRSKATNTDLKSVRDRKRVFIGHGRAMKEALELQKYLREDLHVDAKIFEDLKKESGCKAIVELLDYFQNEVGYAIIVFTPDDYGCLGETMDDLANRLCRDKKRSKTEIVDEICRAMDRRARQNVVFELGLFLGAIGRDRVCYLLQKNVSETPSNMDGVLHEAFDESISEAFPAVMEKLKKRKLVKA